MARKKDTGIVVQVLRLCTDGTLNACSFLYAVAERAARALGYFGIDTFIKEEEPGASLFAVQWEEVGGTDGRAWSCPSRPREVKESTEGPKRKFAKAL